MVAVPFVADSDFVLYVGDACDTLAKLPAESADCCVTSPPYWGLRNYGHDGQVGLETTPGEYIEAMVAVFAEVRRVLKPAGTLWLNLGDSYAGGGCGARDPARWPKQSRNDHMPKHVKAASGLKDKDLVMIPAEVALALRADGWWLRSEIVWHKPNSMPESVTDRPTKAHEMVYLFAKSARYFYDAKAIAEPATWYGPNGQPKEGPHAGQMKASAGAKRPQQRRAVELAEQHGLTEAHFEAIRSVGITDTGKAQVTQDGTGKSDPEKQRLADEAKAALGGYYREFLIPLTRNARSVWSIQTMQYADAHFATFPEELPRRCILAGCPEGGTVLDPFMGSGTTALAARGLGRKAVGVELNPEYAALCADRLSQLSLLAEGAA